MAETLQHSQAAQRPWIQTAGAGEHRLGGPETVNARTMKMNHFVGVYQCSHHTHRHTSESFHETPQLWWVSEYLPIPRSLTSSFSYFLLYYFHNSA